MRLSKQHRQILLVLLRHNGRGLRFSEIVRPVKELRMKKWELSRNELKLPRPRVLSASFSRSLRTLLERGLVEKEYVWQWRGPAWSLTVEGQVAAKKIKQELKRRIEELDEFRYLL